MKQFLLIGAMVVAVANGGAALLSWPVGNAAVDTDPQSLLCIADSVTGFHKEGSDEGSCPKNSSVANLLNSFSEGALLKLAQQLRDAGDRNTTVKEFEQRLRLLCGARQVYLSAIQREPLNARMLVNWANIEQLVGGQCAGDTSDELSRSTKISQTLDLALQQEPYSPRILNSAAFIKLRAGERAQALPLIRRLLEYNVKPSADQESRILRALVTAEDVAAAIPPRFPQIERWSANLYPRVNADLRENRANQLTSRVPGAPESGSLVRALADLQRQALVNSEAELARGAISRAQQVSRLTGLSEFSATDEIRRAIDLALASLRGGESIGGRDALTNEYLIKRSKLSRLEVITAALAGDTRPERTALTFWGQRTPQYFDEYYTSLGAFIPPGRSVRLVELVNRDLEPTRLLPAQVQYFTSSDNLSWEEAFPVGQPVNIDLGNSSRFVAELKLPATVRYLKVHFAAPLRQRRWRGIPEDFLRIFGEEDSPAAKAAVAEPVAEHKEDQL